MKVLVLNGPNLNLLGKREPHIYGDLNLQQIEAHLIAKYQDIAFEFFQSCSESKIVGQIHHAWETKTNAVIINAGALTHTSIAIRDAFLATQLPFVEVHLSNIYQREQFRHHSYLSDCAVGVIIGFKGMVYPLAVDALKDYLQFQNKQGAF